MAETVEITSETTPGITDWKVEAEKWKKDYQTLQRTNSTKDKRTREIEARLAEESLARRSDIGRVEEMLGAMLETFSSAQGYEGLKGVKEKVGKRAESEKYFTQRFADLIRALPEEDGLETFNSDAKYAEPREAFRSGRVDEAILMVKALRDTPSNPRMSDEEFESAVQKAVDKKLAARNEVDTKPSTGKIGGNTMAELLATKKENMTRTEAVEYQKKLRDAASKEAPRSLM